MKTYLSLIGTSFLGGGGRVLDPICTMSLYLPFFSFDGAPYTIISNNILIQRMIHFKYTRRRSRGDSIIHSVEGRGKHLHLLHLQQVQVHKDNRQL